MIGAKENKKSLEIEDAIHFGLINKNVVQMVDKFSSKNNLNKSVFVDGIIDPGVKKIDSLLSKMYRKVHLELDHDFLLTDIKDVIRCSIIVDNYDQVIPLIRELRKSIPSLKGDVCENKTGYIGIHLSLIVNGINAEMQIATRESWYAKQAGEEIYERWRNFSLSKEASELFAIADKNLKKEKAKQLFSQYTLKSIQLSYCKNMFSSLHKYTKLDKLKESINAVLYLNNCENKFSDDDNLKKYKIRIKDVSNHEEFLDNCQDYLQLANESKKDLIDCAKKALNIVRNKKDFDYDKLLSKQERDFMLLKKKYFSLLTKEMKSKFNGKFEITRYISKLNKISNKLALENINYLKNNWLDNLVINMESEDIINLEEIVRRDIVSKNYFLSLIDIKSN